MDRPAATVFLVDDDRDARESLADLVASVGLRAECFPAAPEFLDRFDADVFGCLVCDVRMPRMNGLELHETLLDRGCELPVIFVTAFPDVELAVRAIKAGALDFFEKPFKPQHLLDRIQEALALDVERRARRRRFLEEAHRLQSLTPREHDVMRRLIGGLSGKEIAADLGISYKTMEKFRAKVMRKMSVGSIAELVLAAVHLGLVPSEAGSL